MTDVNGRFVTDKKSWPYAFSHWVKTVGIANGQTLDKNDLYALKAYRTDWEREGFSAPIYYSRILQSRMDRDAMPPAQKLALAPPTEASKEDIARFLRVLYAPYERGWIEMRALAPDWAKRPPKREWFPIAETIADPAEFTQTALCWASQQLNVYAGVLPRSGPNGGTKKSVREAGAIWAEMDFGKSGTEEDVVKKARDANPDMIVHSGGGLHLYWVSSAPMPLSPENVGKFEKRLHSRQSAMGGDSVHDITRILRVPSTTNWKIQNNPRKVRLLEWL